MSAEPQRGPTGTTTDRDCPPASDPDVTLARLNNQICWYARQAKAAYLGHTLLKLATLTSAAAIPVLAVANAPTVLAAMLGGGIVAVEGIQELYQLQRNWVAYGGTREALKNEKFLYLAAAGPYVRARDRHRILAERVEALIAGETAAWASRENDAEGASQKLV